MNDCRQIMLARIDRAGEHREVLCTRRREGGAHIIQLSWGDITRLAYGDRAVCQRLSLDAPALKRLAQTMGWQQSLLAGLSAFFSDGHTVLSDLLDICDRAGIAARYSIVGATSGLLPASIGFPRPDAGLRPHLSLVP